MFSALHDCGHVSLWRSESVAPKPGEHMTCSHCGEATTVTALLGPYRAQCMDCRRVDFHAVFRKTIERAAVTHLQTWTRHRVRVWQFGNKDSVRIITSKDTGAQPELFSPDAPF